MTAAPPAVTLIRITGCPSGPGSPCYLAIRSAEAVEFLARMSEGDLDADTRAWSVLTAPSLRQLARDILLASGDRAVALIGIVEDGRWLTWEPPVPSPPVPEEDR